MNKIHFKLTLLKNKLIFSENFLYKILFIGSFMFMPFMLYKNEIIYYSITNSIEARFTLITMIGLLINKILIKSPKIKSKKNIFKLLINSV